MTVNATALDEFGFHVTPLLRTDFCPEHGEFEAQCYCRNIWTKCPVCARQRFANQKAKDEAKSKAAAVENWLQRVGMAGIPERFRDRTLATYIASTEPQRRALGFARRYADAFNQVSQTGRSAIFIGRPGTGKTHLAAGIALEVMQHWNGSVLFTTTLRAIRRIKDSWHHRSQETESKAIAALVFPDLLILDEVGIQFGSDAEKMILFDVLNDRYEKRRPTLLLSNLALTEVRGYLGERVFDRLREDGGEVVVFDWASHRGADNARQGGGQ